MKTLRATLVVLLFTLLTAAGIYLVIKSAGGNSVSLPQVITASSMCPVAGCGAPTCHGGGVVPKLAPGQTMRCPKVGHAQDRLTSHYQSPQSASLDLWILGLSIFTIAMILIAFYV